MIDVSQEQELRNVVRYLRERAEELRGLARRTRHVERQNYYTRLAKAEGLLEAAGAIEEVIRQD